MLSRPTRPAVVLLLSVSLLSLSASGRAQLPPASAIGPEELISTAYMERPSISTDSRGQPHIVCDNGGKTDFMKFHKVNGQWSGGIFAVGSRGGRYSASRLYVGQIEIDPRDRAWISCKFGTKEFGSMLGQGVWLFRDVATSPNPPEQFFRFVVVYKGMGLVSTDAKYPDQGVVLGTFGNYQILDTSGRTIGSGSINAGHGGEKVRFRIASYAPRFGASGAYPDGIWHTCMNGYSALDSKYQNSLLYRSGKGPITWASYRVYPQMGDDLSHPGLGIDLSDPRVAYMGGVFNGIVCANIWNGERMVAPPDRLIVLGIGATREVRHGPAFTPAPGPQGGTYVFWSAGGRIKMAYLSKAGHVSQPLDIAAGRSPAATTDRFGHIHVVYWQNGIRYRKITIVTLEPLFPRGRILASRTPRFRWTQTRAERYSLEITRDWESLPAFSVTTPNWTPGEALPVGSYTWRVKEGWPKSSSPWSARQSFVIPPYAPTGLTPKARLEVVPARPRFRWMAEDPAVTHFRIELYQRGDLLAEYHIPREEANAEKESFAFKCPDALPAGAFAWRIRGIRRHPSNAALHVASEWSPLLPFQIGVPGKPTLLAPDGETTFEPGWHPIRFEWSAADGAESHRLRILFNGTLFIETDHLDALHCTLSRAWAPGYYTALVQGRNPYGDGAWSDRLTFIVRRQMFPGQHTTRANPPRLFEWTRQPNATRYRLRLTLYNNREERYEEVLAKWIPQPDQGAPFWRPSFILPTGAYRWSVTDYQGKEPGYTSVDYFQVRVPGRTDPLTPRGDSVGHRELPFRWQDPSGFAEQFQIQIWQGNTCLRNSGWMEASSLLEKSDYTFFKKFNFADDIQGVFTWKVRGRNRDGVGPWRMLTFTLVPLDTPAILEPDGSTPLSAGIPQTILWSPVLGATHYQIQILQDETLLRDDRVPAPDPGEDPSWTWTPPAPGRYTLRVRGGREGWSRWGWQHDLTVQ